jgi:multidrug efflux pump subunit AcrB
LGRDDIIPAIVFCREVAFISGVAPLGVVTGAGAEMQQLLGVAVFSGILGVTGVGLLFTPGAFYTAVRRFGIRNQTIPRMPK